MKRINKNNTPDCIQSFIDRQLSIEPEPVNLTYRDFPRKSELRDTLTREQYGICGYTGAPVDDRISKLQSNSSSVSFKNHIEHLKCQKICRIEIEAQGKEFGRVVADDLNYQNMIVALEVCGAAVERFGAVVKADQELPVLPTMEGCEKHFVFREADGSVEGADESGISSVAVLKLDHETLKGWRLSALSVWLDPDVIQTREDFIEVIQAVTTPVDERLPEFAYVIESVARSHINETHL
ncbi:hypothetical protein CO611_09960 [Lysobacteraceae bacterium NML03-0222]|nr:hypothetical protein CO611_09960 [Xanthomonadaceae bacterium NML03-0222]